MIRLENKVVLLTGALGGFGNEFIKQLSSKGVKIIATDIIADYDKNASFNSEHIIGYIQSDLSSLDGCIHVYKESKKYSKNIDILINNAGIAFIGGFLNISDEKINKLLNVNLYAPIYLSKLIIPDMVENKGGIILNISSVAGLISTPNLSYYSISKAGLRALGESIHEEYFDKGIKVTNAFPFFANTDIMKSEQVQMDKKMEVPKFLLDEPDDIVKEIIEGIELERNNVYPGFKSKGLSFIQRFLPDLLSILRRGI